MLQELIEMLDDGEIDDCFHPDPALNADGWCDSCFIKNMKYVSMTEPYFSQETTEKQRDTILKIWNRYCDDGVWDDEE